MDSIGHIDSDAMKGFVKKLCLVSKRYSEKHNAAKNLDNHLNKIENKKVSKKEISELQSKINQVLHIEKKILRTSKIESSREQELLKKINQLETDLADAKKERDKVVINNKIQIEELSLSLLSIKTQLDALSEEKRKKEEKFRNIEKKARNLNVPSH
ncbi:hypothetical protein ISS07_03590 [Candidatus Woesearchaeota archaeon]|nr:hypothetical protein [Candidatus Woesearchaeota archaeon]